VLHALLLFAIELVLKIDILFIHTAGCTSCKFESLRSPAPADADAPPWSSLFVWLVAYGWCWFVLREKYCWLIKIMRKLSRFLTFQKPNYMQFSVTGFAAVLKPTAFDGKNFMRKLRWCCG
jgi:hypothetical protein